MMHVHFFFLFSFSVYFIGFYVGFPLDGVGVHELGAFTYVYFTTIRLGFF